MPSCRSLRGGAEGRSGSIDADGQVPDRVRRGSGRALTDQVQVQALRRDREEEVLDLRVVCASPSAASPPHPRRRSTSRRPAARAGGLWPLRRRQSARRAARGEAGPSQAAGHPLSGHGRERRRARGLTRCQNVSSLLTFSPVTRFIGHADMAAGGDEGTWSGAVVPLARAGGKASWEAASASAVLLGLRKCAPQRARTREPPAPRGGRPWRSREKALGRRSPYAT